MEIEKEQPIEEATQSPVANDAEVLQKIISEMAPLSPETRRRMIETVCTFFGFGRPPSSQSAPPSGLAKQTAEPTAHFRFSENELPSPKQFMAEKSPITDVERVACLAFYLTQYRSMPHFKTKDINELNTEAAQRRFSNAAFAVVNATNAGFLVPSVKGCKQLSADGEQYVLALPDQNAAREAMERVKRRRNNKRSPNKVENVPKK